MTKTKTITLKPLIYFMASFIIFLIIFTDKFSIFSIKMIAAVGLFSMIFDIDDFIKGKKND